MTISPIDTELSLLLQVGEPLKSSRRVGVELEWEFRQPNLWPPRSGWERKTENSLRNGCEYVFCAPTEMSDAWLLLQRQCTPPDKREPLLLSQRCSTHIHIDVLPLTMREILTYLALLAVIEPFLLETLGRQRNGNLFCSSAYETDGMDLFLSHLEKKAFGRRGVLFHVPNGTRKYTTLNTDTISTFGSIEVRCFPGSGDAAEIYRWVCALMATRDEATKWRDPHEFYAYLCRVKAPGLQQERQRLLAPFGIPVSIAHNSDFVRAGFLTAARICETLMYFEDNGRVSQDVWEARLRKSAPSGAQWQDLMFVAPVEPPSSSLQTQIELFGGPVVVPAFTQNYTATDSDLLRNPEDGDEEFV